MNRITRHFSVLRRPVLVRTALLAVIPFAFVACGGDDTVDLNTGSDAPLVSDEPASGDDGTTVPEGPLGAGPYPISTLEITVTHPTISDVNYTLSCLGDTATVTGEADVVADVACLALNEEPIRTRLIEGAPSDQVCTEQYGGPDEARIVGTLDGDDIDTTVDRSNGCGIDDWDSLLAKLLPSPIGVTE